MGRPCILAGAVPKKYVLIQNFDDQGYPEYLPQGDNKEDGSWPQLQPTVAMEKLYAWWLL